jgi:hypothetical protein
MQELRRGSLLSSNKTGGFEAVATSTERQLSAGFQPGPDGTFNTMPASTGRIAPQRLAVKPVGIAQAEIPKVTPSSTEGVQEITVLPISAVSAGLLSPKTGQSYLLWNTQQLSFVELFLHFFQFVVLTLPCINLMVTSKT